MKAFVAGSYQQKIFSRLFSFNFVFSIAPMIRYIIVLLDREVRKCASYTYLIFKDTYIINDY